MKKTFVSFAIALAVISCSKQEMQQTTDTIKSADSLLTSAKESYKTIDSISKAVKSDSLLNSIKIPEIGEVSKVITESNKSIDSLNKELNSIKEKFGKNKDIIKTVDSATQVIKGDGNALEKITVITETINKVSKKAQTKKENPSTHQNSTENSTQEKTYTAPTTPPPPQAQQEHEYITNPIVKTAHLEISVNNLEDARAQLAMELRKFGGEIVTERFGEQNSYRKQMISAKVPYKYFNEVTNNLTQNLGEIQVKNIETEGIDYVPEQMCDLDIVLNENSQFNSNENVLNNDNKPDTFGEKSTDAFKKGFSGFGDVLVALIPFWPVALIGGLVWFFIARNNKKKREEEFQRQLALERERQKYTQESHTQNLQQNENSEYTNPENSDKDDLSRYMPKN